MEYLFSKWGALKDALQDNNLFIFLDFDGTLAPIAGTPKQAALPQAVKRILKKLSANPRFKLAFISGRALADIKNKVGLKNAIYSGNHGLEIEGPKIKFRSLVSRRYKLAISRIKDDLKKRTAGIKGALVEDKGITLSLHYRLVPEKLIPLVKTIFHEIVTPDLIRNNIKIKRGKKVFEVRPALEWDKGKIVLWLLARQMFVWKGRRALPLYVGDDLTDEDAFRALKNKGLTVFVGRRRPSLAHYYVRGPQEVEEFLKKILEA